MPRLSQGALVDVGACPQQSAKTSPSLPAGKKPQGQPEVNAYGRLIILLERARSPRHAQSPAHVHGLPDIQEYIRAFQNPCGSLSY